MEKEDNIKISVIIPIYNASRYLEKCLKSIIIQSLKEIEIICVNDGSTDTSLSILEKLSKQDKRIIIINQKNLGASKARNAALKIAKGEYCLNIDSDDWVEQDYFKEMYEKAKKDNLDILISNAILEYWNKSEIYVDLNIKDDEILTGQEYIFKFYKENKGGYTWNKLLRRKLYINNNVYYDEDIFLMEDFQLINILGYYAKRVGKLNKAFYHYIIGENNASRKSTIKNLEDVKRSYKKIINFYQSKDQEMISEMVKMDMELHLMDRILRGKYFEKKEYNKFVYKFIKEIKENLKTKEEYKTKYDKFLIKILILLKKININFYKIIIGIAKQILLLNTLKNGLLNRKESK